MLILVCNYLFYVQLKKSSKTFITFVVFKESIDTVLDAGFVVLHIYEKSLKCTG